MRYLLLVALAGLAVGPAFAAEWVWDQLTPDSYGGASWIDNDNPSDATSADDFLCDQTGYIKTVKFMGWSYYGEAYINQFVVDFYNDVPATPNDQSHPGDLLASYTLPFTSEGSLPYTYTVQLPGDGFFQDGTPTNPKVYWISIRGLMVDDGFFDAWYWSFKDRNIPAWNDDAAFTSTYFGYPPWSSWGVDPAGTVSLYDGPLPGGWTSLDMCYKLIGDKVPEPASLLLIGLGALLLRRR